MREHDVFPVNYEKIYSLDILKNKYAGMGFAPERYSTLVKIETEKAFDSIFGRDSLSDFSVEGESIKEYVKDMMFRENVATPADEDLAYYCKAFIIYSMTEKEPVVTVTRNGKKEAVYDLPGLDHGKDDAVLDNIPIKGKQSEISTSAGIRYSYDAEIPSVQKALAGIGVAPKDADIVNSLFINWLIGKKGYSFATINKFDTLSIKQKNKVASEFFNDIANHPVIGVEADKVEESIKWLAGMTNSFMNKYEISFKVPSEKQFEANEFRKTRFGESFAFAARQGAGINRFLDGLFQKGGAAGPDNPYGVDYRSAFCKNYSDIDEYIRHKTELQFAEAMDKLNGISSYTGIETLKKVKNYMNDAKGKTFKDGVGKIALVELSAYSTIFNDKAKQMDEESVYDYHQSAVRNELERIDQTYYPELEEICKVDIEKMTAVDLAKAEKVFDSIFSGVTELEKPYLIEKGQKSIVDNFDNTDRYEFAKEVDERVKSGNIRQEERESYTKVLILNELWLTTKKRKTHRDAWGIERVSSEKETINIRYQYLKREEGEIKGGKVYRLDGNIVDNKKKVSEEALQKNIAAGEKIRAEKEKEWEKVSSEFELQEIKKEHEKNVISAIFKGQDLIEDKRRSVVDFKNNGPFVYSKNVTYESIEEGFNEFFVLYLLAEKDIDLNKLRNMILSSTDKRETRNTLQSYANEFINELKKRPIKSFKDLTPEEHKMNLRWYGRFIKKGLEKAFEKGYVFPDQDTFQNQDALKSCFYSAQEQIRSYFAISIPAILTIKSVKVTKNNPYGIDRSEEFKIGLGGQETGANLLDTMQFVKYIGGYLLNGASPTRSDYNRGICRTISELCIIPVFAGKNIKDIKSGDIRYYSEYIKAIDDATDDEEQSCEKILTAEEWKQIANLKTGMIKDGLPEIYKKLVLGLAEMIPFSEEIVKAAEEYGYQRKELSEDNQKTLEKLNQIKKDSASIDRKIKEEKESSHKFIEEEAIWEKELPEKKAELRKRNEEKALKKAEEKRKAAEAKNDENVKKKAEEETEGNITEGADDIKVVQGKKKPSKKEFLRDGMTEEELKVEEAEKALKEKKDRYSEGSLSPKIKTASFVQNADDAAKVFTDAGFFFKTKGNVTASDIQKEVGSFAVAYAYAEMGMSFAEIAKLGNEQKYEITSKMLEEVKNHPIGSDNPAASENLKWYGGFIQKISNRMRDIEMPSSRIYESMDASAEYRSSELHPVYYLKNAWSLIHRNLKVEKNGKYEDDKTRSSAYGSGFEGGNYGRELNILTSISNYREITANAFNPGKPLITRAVSKLCGELMARAVEGKKLKDLSSQEVKDFLTETRAFYYGDAVSKALGKKLAKYPSKLLEAITDSKNIASLEDEMLAKDNYAELAAFMKDLSSVISSSKLLSNEALRVEKRNADIIKEREQIEQERKIRLEEERKKEEERLEKIKEEEEKRLAKEAHDKRYNDLINDEEFKKNAVSGYVKNRSNIEAIETGIRYTQEKLDDGTSSDRASDEARIFVLKQYVAELKAKSEKEKAERDAAYKAAENSKELEAVIFIEDLIGETGEGGFLNETINRVYKRRFNANEIKEKFSKCKTNREKEDFFMDFANKFPKAWEYAGDNSLSPLEIRNSGDKAELIEYFNKNQRNIKATEKARLIQRIRLLEKAEISYNDERDKAPEGLFVPKPNITVNSENDYSIDVSIDRSQTSLNGCWSCSLQAQLLAQGINISQEEIRNFKPNYSKNRINSDSFKKSVDAELRSDKSRDITEMSDVVFSFKPNVMMRSFEIRTASDANSALAGAGNINREAYYKSAAKLAKEKIKEIILKEKAPVSIMTKDHYITITGMKGNDIEFIDSNTRGNVRNKDHTDLDDFIRDTLKSSLAAPETKIQLVWLTEMELSSDGKTFYNVPSNYLELNEDGSYKMPPESIIEDAKHDGSPIENDGIRVRLVGGMDDTEFDRITRVPLDENNLLVVESAVVPKKLNVDLLKQKMQSRSEARKTELESYRRNLLENVKDKFGTEKKGEAEKTAYKDDSDVRRSAYTLDNEGINEAVQIGIRSKVDTDSSRAASKEERIRREGRNIIVEKETTRVQVQELLTEFKDCNGLFGIKPEEMHDASGHEYLWNQPGAILAFRLKLAYDNAMRLFDYVGNKGGRKGYLKHIEVVTEGYNKIMSKLDLPENAITTEAGTQAYPFKGYFKNTDDCVEALKVLTSIGDKISLIDFSSMSRKNAVQYNELHKYNPTLAGRNAETIREFTDHRVKLNILKTCTENRDYNDALKDALMLPGTDSNLMNTRANSRENKVLDDYFDFGVEITDSFIHGDKGNIDSAVSSHKRFAESIMTPEGKKYLPYIRNNYIRDEEVVKEDTRRIKYLENPTLVAEEEAQAKRLKEEKLAAYERETNLNIVQFRDFVTDGTYARKVLVDAGFPADISDQSILDNIFIYAMAEKDMSIADIAKASPEERKKLTEDFLADVEKHPFDSEASEKLTEDEFKENIRWYGQLYKKAHNKLETLEYKFPDGKLLADAKFAENFRKSEYYIPKSLLNTLIDPTAKDSLFAKTAGEHNPHGVIRLDEFREAYGPNATFVKKAHQIRGIIAFENAVDAQAHPEKSLKEKIAVRFYLEMEMLPYGEGKKFGEEILPVVPKDQTSRNWKSDTEKVSDVFDIDDVFKGVEAEEIEKMASMSFEDVAVEKPEIALKLINYRKNKRFGYVSKHYQELIRDEQAEDLTTEDVKEYYTEQRNKKSEERSKLREEYKDILEEAPAAEESHVAEESRVEETAHIAEESHVAEESAVKAESENEIQEEKSEIKDEPEVKVEEVKTEPEVKVEEVKTEPEVKVEEVKTEPEVKVEEVKTEPEVKAESMPDSMQRSNDNPINDNPINDNPINDNPINDIQPHAAHGSENRIIGNDNNAQAAHVKELPSAELSGQYKKALKASAAYNEFVYRTVIYLKKLKAKLISCLPENRTNGILAMAIDNTVSVLGNMERSSVEVGTALYNLHRESLRSKEALSRYSKNRRIPENDYRKIWYNESVEMIKDSQHLLTAFNTVRRWVNESDLKTLDGKAFHAANPLEIGEKLKALNEQYEMNPGNAEKTGRKAGKEELNCANVQLEMFRIIANRYEVNLKLGIDTLDPNDFVVKKNDPSAYDSAMNFVLTDFICDIQKMDVVTSDEKWNELKNFIIRDDNVKRKAKKLSENPVFKAVAKSRPDDFYSEWKRVLKETAVLRNEMTSDIENTYRNPEYSDYLFSDVNPDKRTERYIKLASILTRQVLTDPRNSVFLQGVAADMYNLGVMTDKIATYLERKNKLADESPAARERLIAELNSGRLRDTVLSSVVKKMKPEKLVRVERPRAANNPAANNRAANNQAANDQAANNRRHGSQVGPRIQ